ncbi:cytochrome c subunit VIIa [Pyrrhoderma noxium]|uniref:Cytochrome c subunit VIIa n=1 Tax=Pyrrhoderma noxium TaxID=2282107 RepID=A0A286UNB6_9AGAM|nr:cytochrome c subunit VIIa [Pyrrhoderma noxium]
MDYLVKIPNKISERQRYYQNNAQPLYFRPPRSKLYLRSWFTGLFVGLAGVGYGAFSLIKGKQTEAS